MRKKDDFSPKQKLFILEYLKDLNATQAAIRAGYSSRTACEQSSRLLANVKIQEELSKAQAERAERTQVTADRVIEEIALIAFSDLTDLVDICPERKTITLKSADKLKGGITRLIKKIKVKDGNFEIELWDKVGGLEKLMRHLGLDKTVLTPPDPAAGYVETLANDPLLDALEPVVEEVWGDGQADTI